MAKTPITDLIVSNLGEEIDLDIMDRNWAEYDHDDLGNMLYDYVEAFKRMTDHAKALEIKCKKLELSRDILQKHIEIMYDI